MFGNFHCKKITHPDWVLDACSKLVSTASLYSQRKIPGTIEVPMVIIPVKRILRGVYGSDMRAALALLEMAISKWFSDLWYLRLTPFWLFTVMRKDREAYFEDKCK